MKVNMKFNTASVTIIVFETETETTKVSLSNAIIVTEVV